MVTKTLDFLVSWVSTVRGGDVRKRKTKQIGKIKVVYCLELYFGYLFFCYYKEMNNNVLSYRYALHLSSCKVHVSSSSS